MATFADLKTRIADELHRTDLTSQISKAVLSAVQFYAVHRFTGNEKRGTITTIDGTRFYDTSTASPGTLPTDIADIDSIVCTVSGGDYMLEKVPYEELEDTDPGTTLNTGDPIKWAWYANKLRLYPTPNAARVLTLSYQTILTALSADGDTNFWTNDLGEQLIRARAKKDIAANVLHNDALAAKMDLLEREALSQLRKHTNKLAGSGRIRATDF